MSQITPNDTKYFHQAVALYWTVFGGPPAWYFAKTDLSDPVRVQRLTGEMFEIIGLAYAHWASRGYVPLVDEVEA